MNREWSIALTLGDAREIERAIGVSFLEFPATLKKMEENPWLLFDLCWELVKTQVEQNGIDKKVFYNTGIAGSVESFRSVLFEAWADFLAAAGLSPAAKMLRKANEKAADFEKRLDAEIDRALDEALSQLDLGTSFSNLPQPAGSTGDP
jgi:hypothetical protein